MGRFYNHLTWSERLQIEEMTRHGYTVMKIAKAMNRSRGTIYNELKRGQYLHRKRDYLPEEIRYSSDLAQRKAEDNLKVRGTQMKICNDYDYADFLENMILEKGLSPAAVLGQLKAQKKEDRFKTKICLRTLYNYIDKGVFLHLTNKDLPVKGKRKRGYRKIKRIQKRSSIGTSIDFRSEDIKDRQEFGHWEMDTVVGKRGISRHSLLVLTERRTRKEIIRKLKSHTAAAVCEELDLLERKLGAQTFSSLFKTITVDNGTEFSYADRMEKSIYSDQKRTSVYYCHPYCSWERGSNEVANKMIRRKIPKSTNFDHLNDDEIAAIEKWMNDYPRKIFDFHTANEIFEREVMNLAM